MEYSYAQKCDFVAIFDADFQPQSDFLMKTIPFLMNNPKIGLVQARWQFGKSDQTSIIIHYPTWYILTKTVILLLSSGFSKFIVLLHVIGL